MDDASLPGVYAGVFPCQNCPGIRATLWLRSDGRFFFSQAYLDSAEGEQEAVYNLGRWRPVARGKGIELRGDGPRRIFSRADADTLVLNTDAADEHRLSRRSAQADFTPAISMSGMMAVTGHNASFTECLTGLTATVEESDQLARFRQQFRSVDAQGKPVFVEFKGRFVWAKGGSLRSIAIDRFASIKENRSC